ncbi:MAG TPA: penicillin-binding transpeptidase domain-containing protein [Myxococcota bacterium]
MAMGDARAQRPRMRMRGRLTIAAICGGLPLAIVALLSAPSAKSAAAPPLLPAIEVPAQHAAAALPPGGNGSAPSALPPVSSPPAPQPRRAALPPDALSAPTSRAAVRALAESAGSFERTFALADHESVRLRYSLDPELTRAIWRIVEQGHVARAHIVVMDLETGALAAYVSTDPATFPPDRAYPAASLVKVVTAAAALDAAPSLAHSSCRFAGSPYVLTPARVNPPKRGAEITLERALATSNNQCFAQWAVHRVGARGMLDAIDRFGLLSPPAPDHPPGDVKDPGTDLYKLGRLGCGLDGLMITPLHAVQLAGTLAHGRLLEPHWIDSAYDADGEALEVTSAARERVVLSESLARQLRVLLRETTERGTARRAFRPRGRPLLPGIAVAGKTGSLTGTNPAGRYEWFAGVAPAEHPRLAIATVTVQGPRWWTSGSQLAAQVFRAAFCPAGRCSADAVDRLATHRRGSALASHAAGDSVLAPKP